MTTNYSLINYKNLELKTRPMITTLASKVSYIIMRAILEHDLEVADSDSYFVWYKNSNGLDIRIYLSDLTDDREYRVEINNHTHITVSEDGLLDLIEVELLMP